MSCTFDDPSVCPFDVDCSKVKTPSSYRWRLSKSNETFSGDKLYAIKKFHAFSIDVHIYYGNNNFGQRLFVVIWQQLLLAVTVRT
jgi:hypothetical protein